MAKQNKNSNDSDHIVFSTDWLDPRKCPQCKVIEAECKCTLSELMKGIKPEVRVEKKGRGGKAVTVVARLPNSAKLLSTLSAKLKKSIGCGGTHYLDGENGVVEVQGERKEQVLKILSNL